VANIVYNIAKKQLLDADLDFNLPNDIRVLLLQANTDHNPDDLSVQAVLARAGTTELTSTGYTRADGVMTGEGTVQDNGPNLAYFDANDVTFAGVSQLAAEQVTGYLVFKFITDDAGSIPILLVDTATGFPLTPNGSDIQIQWNAAGILQIT
jgi:hypothetical protein